MEDFSLLNGLYEELNTAVGKVISDHSVMEGYSNTADEIKEKLDKNIKEVDELKDVYRYFANVVHLLQVFSDSLPSCRFDVVDIGSCNPSNLLVTLTDYRHV